MFIPDYLGNDVWTLPLINREHYKIQKVIEEENNEMPVDNLPWIQLNIGYSWQTWEKEIKGLDTLNFFNVHKNEYSRGWRSLTLYDGEWNEKITEHCYVMTSWFKQTFPTKKIEIMALDSLGYIELHKNKKTDKHDFNVIKFMFDKPSYYNVAMFNPNPMDKTKLKDKDYIGRIPCETGKALMLDSGNYFTARNMSEQTVYYLVVQINTFDLKNEDIRETIGNIKTNARI